jgi:hypothetical protein
MPTLLDIFGKNIPLEVTGKSLLPLMRGELHADAHEKKGAIFGQFGAAINYTDGRYTYFLYPIKPFETDLFQYTLMPAHMRTFFEAGEFTDASMVDTLKFTRGYPVMRLPVRSDAKANMTRRYPLLEAQTALYDLHTDPQQRHPVKDTALEMRMRSAVAALLQANEAPAELFDRYGLSDALSALEQTQVMPA